MEIHEEILALARSRPAAALQRIGAMLNLGDIVGIDRIRILQAGGIAARLTGDLALSNRYLRDATALATHHDDESGFIQANITRAGNSLLAGKPDDAIKRLQSLGQPNDPELAARLGLQLGTIYARSSRFGHAVSHFSSGLEAAHQAKDKRLVAVITKNRGMLRMFSGDYRSAREDLEFARTGFDKLGIDIEVAYCDHNLGQLADYTGDLARALPLFSAAEKRIAELAGSQWEVQASHCDALLRAGLGEEAAELGAEICSQLDHADHNLDRGEALLAWARAEMLRDDFATAHRIAEEAISVFESQQRTHWRAHAVLVAAQARTHLGQSVDIAALKSVVADLDTAHLPLAWLETELAIADAHASAKPYKTVARLQDVGHALKRAPVDLRLGGVALMAEARLRLGDRRGADAAARTAFRLLYDYQRVLATGDLQVGVRRHARRAGAVGLSVAVAAHQPRRIFDWLERDKWAVLQNAKAEAHPDSGLRSALARYRALDGEMRRSGGADPTLQRLHRDAERWIRDLNRVNRPSLRVANTPTTATDVAATIEGTTVISLGVHNSTLIAVKLRNNRATLHNLGSSDRAVRLNRLARSALSRIALGYPEHSAADDLTSLSEQIITPIGTIDAKALLLPPPELFGTPWRSLPGLFGRQVTISPSATMWMRRPERSEDGTSLLVSGPDLELAETEVHQIRGSLPRSVVLSGKSATVEAVLAEANRSDLVHIAAHGINRSDNPLFSSVQLADGPMNVYELGQLQQPPSTVVLSACHVGLPAESPGHELLGLVGGLLRIGSRTIVASTLPLPDDSTTADFMTSFHQSFAGGAAASAALNDADAAVESSDLKLLYRSAVNVYGGD
jgi:tetratricopeptide (TPR) repeat protein